MLVWALASVAGLLATTTCGYPEFKYDEGGGGEGGEGPGPPSVPCGNPGGECAPGQVCCYHQSNPTLDHCGQATMCGLEFDELYCNSKADCPNGICCATDDGMMHLLIQCQSTCAAPNEFVMCTVASECPSMSCISIEAPAIYPGYSYCTK